MTSILDRLGDSPKMAIVRGGGMGDLLSTTPALRALRKASPAAHITLITGARLAGLASRYPSIDRILVAPFCPGVSDGPDEPGALERFFEAMQGEKLDLALQWHGGGANSNPFTLRLGARYAAGFQDVDAPPLDLCLPYDPRHHEVLRYLDLLNLLGIPGDGLAMDVPLLPMDFDQLASLGDLIDLDALDRRAYIGTHVGAGAKSRRWSPERFAEVADSLLDEFDLRGVILTAGSHETLYAKRFLDHLKHKDQAVDLSSRTTLGALVALVSKLGLLISNDTGTAHAANALGTPCVIIFGSASPLNWAPLSRTWHRVVANWSSPCRFIANDGCLNTADTPCLLSVGVEEVLGEARQLLRQKEQVARIL